MALQTASDLQKRLIGTVLFLPIIGAIIAGGSFALCALALVAFWISAEFAVLMRQTAQIVKFKKVAVIVLCLSVFSSWGLGYLSGSGVITFMQLLGFFAIILAIIIVLLGRVLFFPMILIGCLFALGVIGQAEFGVEALILLGCIITASDVCAYMSGRFFGGPKLAPAISPSKTWSGSIGGIVGAYGAAFLALYLLASKLAFLPSGGFLWAGVFVMAVLGQMGDLYESWFKRQLNIKDSSNLIPGHGGVLDRFDGYLFALPVLAMFLAIQ